MKTLLSSLTVLVLLFAVNTVAFAAPVDGVWLRKKTGGHVQSYACKGGMGLKIIKSKKTADVGKVIMCGATKVSDNKWKGDLTSTEDGQVYSGFVRIDSNDKLILQGCVLGGLVCKKETWNRLK